MGAAAGSLERLGQVRVDRVVNAWLAYWGEAKIAAVIHTAAYQEILRQQIEREQAERRRLEAQWRADYRAWRLPQIERQVKRELRRAEARVEELVAAYDSLLEDNVRRLHETGFYIEEAPKRRRERAA